MEKSIMFGVNVNISKFSWHLYWSSFLQFLIHCFLCPTAFVSVSPTKEIKMVVGVRRSSMSSSCSSSGYYSSSPTLSSSPPVLCNPKSGMVLFQRWEESLRVLLLHPYESVYTINTDHLPHTIQFLVYIHFPFIKWPLRRVLVFCL